MKDNLDAFKVYLDQTDGTTLNQTLDYQEQETQLEMRLRTIHFISGRLLLLTPMEIKVVPESIRLERISGLSPPHYKLPPRKALKAIKKS